MTDLKRMAALTSLNSMLTKGYVCICTIDTIAKMLGVQPPAEPHSILRSIHCVNFAMMPPELRQAVPDLIRQCLDVEPTYQFPAPKPAISAADLIVHEHSASPERGLLGRLLGKG